MKFVSRRIFTTFIVSGSPSDTQACDYYAVECSVSYIFHTFAAKLSNTHRMGIDMNEKVKTRYCYLSRNYNRTESAGGKAKMDIENIVESMGFHNVGLRRTTAQQPIFHFVLTLSGVLKAACCLRRGDVLLLQYPLKKYYAFVCDMAHLHGAKVVTVIHDLGSFRRQKLTAAQEVKRLSHSDYIIAPNSRMLDWLSQQGCKTPMGTLELFDFLSESRPKSFDDTSSAYRIMYMGALNPRKNSFLYDWIKDLATKPQATYKLSLYGSGFPTDKVPVTDAFEYNGFVQADQLIAEAQGSFGLVWDGASLDACTGNFGEYLQYNNPHKTSLYLRCGLPVIIWNKAALAEFVTRNGVGFSIGSLRELDDVLRSLTPERYAEMRKRVKAVSERLANGEFFRTAANEAIAHLESSEGR